MIVVLPGGVQSRPVVVGDQDNAVVLPAATASVSVILNNAGPKGPASSTGFGVFIPDRQRFPSQLFLRFVSIGRTYISGADSLIEAKSAATADTVLSISVDGVVVGTATILAGTRVAVIALSIDYLDHHQVFELTGPVAPDFSLADITAHFISAPAA